MNDKVIKKEVVPLNNEKGQALVEFAIILPVLALLLFGILDFGMLVIQKYKVQTTAYESAKYISAYSGNDINGDLKNLITRAFNNTDVYYGQPSEGAEIPPDTVYITYTVSSTEADITLTYYARCLTYVTEIFAGGSSFPLSCSAFAAVT